MTAFGTETMADDPYTALGLTRSASDSEIRSAYRKLAKELHPDLNPDDAKAEERFKKVSSAFNVLGDPEKRKRFDRGEIDASGQERADFGIYQRHANGASSRGGAFDPRGGFADIFHDIFGNGGYTERGQDLRYKLEIEFLEAAKGTKKRIVMPEGGTLDLTVPAGVSDGQTLRLKGKGSEGVGGAAAGDALIEITVRAHSLFERDGDDIVIELPITIDEAVLGGRVQVPTISGRVSLSIPEGSNSGQVLRLKGQGIHNNRTGETGDQHVRLKIVMPEKLDPGLKEFFELWRKENEYDPRKDM